MTRTAAIVAFVLIPYPVIGTRPVDFAAPSHVGSPTLHGGSQDLVAESPFGVHRDGPFPSNPAAIRRITDEVHAVGAGWLRINVWWDWIEPSPHERRWATLDLVVQDAVRDSIELLVTIRGYTDDPAYPDAGPTKLAAYRAFVTDLASRYGHEVQYWQIENEVTARNSWKGFIDEYLNVLRTGSTAIKAQEPTAKILLSSIGSGTTDKITNEGTTREGRALFKQFRHLIDSGAPYYDVVDAHIYHRLEDIQKKITLFRSELVRVGPPKPIWVTETGGPDSRVVSDQNRQDTPADQVVKRYTIELAAGVQRIFWHQISANPLGHKNLWSSMALMVGNTPRPAYFAYRLMVNKLAGFTSVSKVPSPAGSHVYRYSKRSGDVFVVWADGPHATVPTPTNAPTTMVTTVLGVRSKLASKTIIATQSPVYIEGG